MRSWFVLIVLAAACGPGTKRPGGTGTTDADGDCTLGTRRCAGNTFQVCEAGGWKTVEFCPLYCSLDGCTSCEGPGCMPDLCMQSAADKSYLGCEYYAVDLDNATEVFGKPLENQPGMECALWPSSKQLTSPHRLCYDGSWAIAGACDRPTDGCPTGFTCVDSPGPMIPLGFCGLDGDGAPFAIVVSNPQAVTVAVTIENAAGQSMSVTVDPDTIKALYPQQLGFADQSIDGTSKSANAYKLTSSAPVVAYQFNPLNNVDVFSNDASLLIPRAGFDTRYIAVSYATLTRRGPNVPGRDDYHGYVTVVAWDDNTQIQVTPTAATLAGKDGTPALQAGVPAMFTLNRFEVLNLEAVAGPDPNTNDGLNGGDLTGTEIKALNGKTFGVFGGHEAVRISAPNSNCCADHLEEMLFPTSTWGKQFSVAPTVARRGAPDILRIVATVPGTQVTFSPQPMGACGPLGPGQHCDVEFTQPTTVTSNQPITVAHLMMSAILNMDGTGDPSLGIVPPEEQYRTDYKFLAPMDYDMQYATIVGVAGDAVTVDGTAVAGWTSFGLGRATATVPLTVGTHRLTCPNKCSVEVYGWSQAVSYLFAGGLNLQQIVIEKGE
ncbi:MAG: IgGFc-binding protein [Deltaproteobacteria bacterium]|nr:IgGFc-binding protein [Deltaproteobacteria bacterium]